MAKEVKNFEIRQFNYETSLVLESKVCKST